MNPFTSPRWRRALIAVADLVLVGAFAAWFYHPFLAPGLPPGDFGSTTMVAEVDDLLREAPELVAGWNPWSLCGRPTLLTASPFRLLALPFTSLEPIDRMKALLVLYHVLAAFTAYALLRGSGAGRAAAVLAGLIYPIMPSHVSRTAVHGNVQIPMLFALLPLVLLALVRLRRWHLRGVLLLTLVLAAGLLRDGQRLMLFLLVFSIALLPAFLHGLGQLARKGRLALTHPALQLVGALGLASVGAVAVTSLDVIPDHYGDPHHVRWVADEQDHGLRKWALRHPYTVLDPNKRLGNWGASKGLDFYGSMSRYVGLSLVGLMAVGGLLGASMGRQRARFLVVAAMLPIAVWLSLGTTPLWPTTRARWAGLFASANVSFGSKLLVVVAGVAVAALLVAIAARQLGGRAGWRRWLRGGLLVALALAAFFLHAPLGWLPRALFFLRDLRNPDWVQVAVGSLAAIYAASLVVGVLHEKFGRRKWWTAAYLALLALVLADFLPYRRFLQRFAVNAPGVEALATAVAGIAADPDAVRVMPAEPYSNLADTTFIWHRKPLAAEFRSYLATPRVRQIVETTFGVIEAPRDADSVGEIAALLGAKYLLDSPQMAPNLEPGPVMLPRWRTGNLVVFENSRALPFVRAWPEAHLLAGPPSSEGVRLAVRLARLGRGLVSPEKAPDAALLSRVAEIHALDPSAPGLGSGRRILPADGDLPALPRVAFPIPPELSWSRPSAESLRVDVDLPLPALVVVGEAFHPWWSARLDGETVTLLPADHAFMGVFVPAGRHVIDLQFRLPGLHVASIWLSLGSLGVLLGWLAWLFVKRRGTGVGDPLS